MNPARKSGAEERGGLTRHVVPTMDDVPCVSCLAHAFSSVETLLRRGPVRSRAASGLKKCGAGRRAESTVHGQVLSSSGCE